LREQQVELGQLVESVTAAIHVDGDLLSADEQEEVKGLLQASRVLLDQTSATADQVRDQVGRLSGATESFAARRMDRSIRQALSGRRVDEITK